MESTSQSATKDWWSEMGKWQALAVFVTLAVYFITLCFTGNNKIAAAAFATFIVGFVGAIVIGTAWPTVFVVLDVFISATFAAAAAFVFAVALAFIDAVTGFVLVAFIVFIVFILVDKMAKCRISKKVIWLSYTVELTLILVPMLISILH